MASINREANNNLSKCPSDHSDTGRISGASLPASSAPIQQITCHITTADNHVYQIMVDHKSEASQVLKKICKKLGIMDESEYFGLQFFGKQNELIWVNLRNQLTRQISGSPPYSLFLKVKYFVQPQRLIQDETKRQFFLNIVEHFQKGEWLGLDASLQLIGEMIALMTHTNYGSFNKTTTPCKYGCFWPESRGEIPNEALRIAANFHQKLNQQTNKITQYEVMRRAHSSLNLYGSHFFECIHMYGYPMKIGVGPEKLFICNPDGTLVEEMVYSRLHVIFLSAKVVTLRILDDAGQAKERQYELKTKSLAQSMYRCITEIHAFFQSDNIPAQVLEQTTNRNVLDSITSLFEHNHGGKEYAFDVMKTAQEVYDQALRNAYHWSQASTTQNREHFFTNVLPPTFNLLEEDPLPVNTRGISSSLSPKLSNRDRGNSVTFSSEGSESSISDISSQVEEVIQEELKSRTLCQFCCSQEINRVFTPCGHAVCCTECSNRVEECPVCRKRIEGRQFFFPPWSCASCNSPSSLAHSVMHKAHLHSHQADSTCSHQHHHSHKSASKRNEEFPGLKRQNSLRLADQQQIRTYADFRSVSKSAMSLDDESKMSRSPPLIPRSLDLAEELGKVMNLEIGAQSGSPSGQNLSQLCVTISNNVSQSAGPCSGDLAPLDPPARVSSGVPTDLMDTAFQMDDSMMHTPVAGTMEPTAQMDTYIYAADRSPLTLLTSVISPSAATPSKE